MEWGFIVFLWFGMGIVGLVLGSIVEKVEAGFALGLFLGPVGWIIVFLLPRVVETKEVSIAQKIGPRVGIARPDAQKTGPGIKIARPERNLESDDYKLWLSKTYNIQKNELFEKYEFDEKLFATLDDALSCVDQTDRGKEAELEQAQRKSELEKTKQVEAEKVAKAAKAAKVFPKF